MKDVISHDVFISYSSSDKAIADAICHRLEEKNVSCWIAPRDVVAGETYAHQIVQAINQCSVVVLVFSKNANMSEHVGNEVSKAFNAKKPILPFMIEETEMSDEFDYYLGRKHWLIAYPNYKEKTENLVNMTLRLLGRENESQNNNAPTEKQEDFVGPNFTDGNGPKDFTQWINEHLVYPEEAKDKGIQGKVVTWFYVDVDGSLCGAKIVEGVDKLLDEEAIRVLNSSPRWSSPAMRDGKAIRYSYTFPIIFKLR